MLLHETAEWDIFRQGWWGFDRHVQILYYCDNAVFLHCPGESGLGKSTLVDSLFLTDLYDDTAIPKAVGKC